MFVRSCFNVAPLYPDAITAWEQADNARHRVSDPDAIPRGYATFFRGGEHGHVCLSLGRGLCLTNDTGVPGTINVARLADISSAWGYQLLGYTTEVNGEEAPRPKPAKPRKPRQTAHQWRVAELRRAIVRARANGHARRARRLRDWLADLRKR